MRRNRTEGQRLGGGKGRVCMVMDGGVSVCVCVCVCVVMDGGVGVCVGGSCVYGDGWWC